VFEVGCVVQYVRMTLMHSGYSMTKKVGFFDCHLRFLLLNNHFLSIMIQSLLKGKLLRQGPPKQKLGSDITKLLRELPYAKALILLHNIDFMHQECNVVKSIIIMCFDLIGQTKDNLNARKDLAILCDCTRLEVSVNPSGN
jgi:hypothetical protein